MNDETASRVADLRKQISEEERIARERIEQLQLLEELLKLRESCEEHLEILTGCTAFEGTRTKGISLKGDNIVNRTPTLVELFSSESLHQAFLEALDKEIAGVQQFLDGMPDAQSKERRNRLQIYSGDPDRRVPV